MDIVEILNDHKLWLDSGYREGVRADLFKADLRKANLYGADLFEADLREADLRRANLCKANLHWADLREANLYEADLYEANLCEARLRRANLCNIKNKNIITFRYNRHFAYYCDGLVKIGCKTMSITDWLEIGKALALAEDYTKKEIEVYSVWINSLKEMLK